MYRDRKEIGVWGSTHPNSAPEATPGAHMVSSELRGVKILALNQAVMCTPLISAFRSHRQAGLQVRGLPGLQKKDWWSRDCTGGAAAVLCSECGDII